MVPPGDVAQLVKLARNGYLAPAWLKTGKLWLEASMASKTRTSPNVIRVSQNLLVLSQHAKDLHRIINSKKNGAQTICHQVKSDATTLGTPQATSSNKKLFFRGIQKISPHEIFSLIFFSNYFWKNFFWPKHRSCNLTWLSCEFFSSIVNYLLLKH